MPHYASWPQTVLDRLRFGSRLQQRTRRRALLLAPAVRLLSLGLLCYQQQQEQEAAHGLRVRAKSPALVRNSISSRWAEPQDAHGDTGALCTAKFEHAGGVLFVG